MLYFMSKSCWLFFLLPLGNPLNPLLTTLLANQYPILNLFPTKAFDRMKDLISKREAAETETVEWTFLGHRVCLRGWKSLHCLGTLVQLPSSFLIMTFLLLMLKYLLSWGNRYGIGLSGLIWNNVARAKHGAAKLFGITPCGSVFCFGLAMPTSQSSLRHSVLMCLTAGGSNSIYQTNVGKQHPLFGMTCLASCCR